MPPRNKRPKHGSGSGTPSTLMDQESSNNQAGNLRLPPPHDELWYEDGNILLATDAHLYRVHKSVLAKQSTVFKDMFELSGMPPEVGEETGKSAMLLSEEWDGLQVVKMFGDSDEDVRYFVKALYNRDFFRTFESATVTLPVLESLVNMSTKYDVRTIRSEEIVEHLKPYYPDTLEAFDALDEPFKDFSGDTDFRLLALARKCEALILLPVLFFFCAIKPLEKIFAAYGIVTREDLRTIIIGRERLFKDANHAEQSMNLEWLGPRDGGCYDEDCLSDRKDWVKIGLAIGLDRSPPFPLFLPDGEDSTSGVDHMCKKCVKLNLKDMRNIRERAWKKLPGTFGLGNWNELGKT